MIVKIFFPYYLKYRFVLLGWQYQPELHYFLYVTR